MNSILIYKKKINKYIKENLPKGSPSILREALKHSTSPGGKRIRPILTLAAYHICEGRGYNILPTACAIELIHTYSLIHDDLPCMDNDDLRRGKPTCHKKFGEDIAILSGDALLTLSFEWISKNSRIDDATKIAIIKEISSKIGVSGLIGGQVLDLRTKPKNLNLQKIKKIHLNKTAALFIASVRIGAIAANTSPKKLRAITIFGKNLGLAFQIVDDLLDLGQDKEKEISYPILVGKKKAENHVIKLVKEALDSLKLFGKKANLLEEIAKKVTDQIR